MSFTLVDPGDILHYDYPNWGGYIAALEGVGFLSSVQQRVGYKVNDDPLYRCWRGYKANDDLYYVWDSTMFEGASTAISPHEFVAVDPEDLEVSPFSEFVGYNNYLSLKGATLASALISSIFNGFPSTPWEIDTVVPTTPHAPDYQTLVIDSYAFDPISHEIQCDVWVRQEVMGVDFSTMIISTSTTPWSNISQPTLTIISEGGGGGDPSVLIPSIDGITSELSLVKSTLDSLNSKMTSDGSSLASILYQILTSLVSLSQIATNTEWIEDCATALDGVDITLGDIDTNIQIMGTIGGVGLSQILKEGFLLTDITGGNQGLADLIGVLVNTLTNQGSQ